MRGLSLVVASGGHSSSRCAGLSLSRPLLLRSTGSRRAGSVIVAHRPSCSAACGIFPDQVSNPCPLHWQADSQPTTAPLGKPDKDLLKVRHLACLTELKHEHAGIQNSSLFLRELTVYTPYMGFWRSSLSDWEHPPLVLVCWVFSSMKAFWILSSAFSASVEMIVWFFFFILLLWCVTFPDVKLTWNSWGKSH